MFLGWLWSKQNEYRAVVLQVFNNKLIEGALRLSNPQIMYNFLIEFLELEVSCLGLVEGGCDCTALAMH